MMNGGEKIRELRKAKGLTLRQLAKKLDIDFTYLSKIENMTLDDKGNPTIPSLKLLIDIAMVLGASPDELLHCYNKPPIKMAEWARTKAFQEFYRSSASRDISAEEWRHLTDYLKTLRNRKVHGQDTNE
jgi:transcriptional regulator with XRE-family HTH domain